MLQNYCFNNYQDFYSKSERGSCYSKPTKKKKISSDDQIEPPDTPLDLSFKSDSSSEDSTTASGFLKENNISYDESIKHNEEVEVVYKDNDDEREKATVYEKKEESVKEFVQRKIDEYKKTETDFRVFVNETNPKEKEIQEKMSQIKEKYSQISNKIKKLEEKKEKLITSQNNEQNNNDLNNTNDANTPQHAADQDVPLKKRKIQDIIDKESNIYLDDSDLSRDGARVLVRLDNVMHPGRMNIIVKDDIYGVVVDKERGNKPHVFSREELLERVVRDVRPGGVEELRLGSRVCVFWSSMINYLHPGIVTGFDDEDQEYVIVSTDDGDTRDVHIKQIRLLPTDFATLGENEY